MSGQRAEGKGQSEGRRSKVKGRGKEGDRRDPSLKPEPSPRPQATSRERNKRPARGSRYNSSLMIRPYRGGMPVVHPTAFVDESAQVIGDVEIGAESSVWMNAVIRGDVNSIRIGERTNVQDGTVIHVM